MNTELTTKTTFDLTPTTLQEAMDQAHMLAGSAIIPKQFQNKPQDILVAVQMGLEVGLKPLQALKNIAVINGTPTIWGDAAIAIVRKSPLCESIVETIDYRKIGDRDILVATCTVKRRGEEPQTRIFDQIDAETAKLWGRNVWASYPKRMLQMRARGFALRDVFPDVLGGLDIAEEQQDKEERDITNRGTEQTQDQRKSSLNDLASGKKPKPKKQPKPDPVITVDQDGTTFTQNEANEYLNESICEMRNCYSYPDLQKIFGPSWSKLKQTGYKDLAEKLESEYQVLKADLLNE